MSLLNLENDGLYPELIVLFKTTLYYKVLKKALLLEMCTPKVSGNHNRALKRLRGVLNRWTDIGLFELDVDNIRINESIWSVVYDSIDKAVENLPGICRKLVLKRENCFPLWGDENQVGVTGDFVRGASWVLAQNIYDFPTTQEDVERIALKQCVTKKILVNHTRWTGLMRWMPYLGLATGEDSASFQIDPTAAIKAVLPSVFAGDSRLTAKDFIMNLADQLPVLDFGRYRQEVESKLNHESWRQPAANHLSMSLSFALRRLMLDEVITLDGRADAGHSFSLTGRNERTWYGFESVSLKYYSI